MTETPEDRPATRIRAWFRRRLDTPLKQAGAALGAAVVVGAVAGTAWFVLTGDDGGEKTAFVDPPGFALSPEGDDVPRLTPVRVTFASAPGERSGEKLLVLEPAVPGTYAWLSDRTLVFQPDFPGLLRGSAYSVTVPPRPETGLTEEVRREFRVTGLLEVQQVIPGDGDTEVPLEAPVLVQFSRSVAPLTTLAAQAAGPALEFDPPLKGTGEWLNTSVYRFVPERLEPFTTYTIRLPKGLTSAADGVLQADFGWSFTTIRPSVAAVVPDANTQFASPTQAVTVTFNQPMDPSAASGIRLVGPDGLVNGSVSWDTTGTVATFTPSARLGYQTTYTTTIAAGLRGANGGETAAERTAAFTTVGVPAVARTMPSDGEVNASFYVQLEFTNPMDPDSLEGKLSITGFTAEEVAESAYAYEFGISLGITLKPSTTYTVTLAPGALDRYGQVMGGYSYTFRTAPLPSSVSLALPGYSAAATFAESGDQALFFHAVNLDEAAFTLYSLTTDEGRNWMFAPYNPREEPDSPPIRTWTVPVAGGLDEVQVLSTSLAGEGGALPAGYYLVETDGDYASSMAFAVVDTELILKRALGELLVWAIDHDTGEPVAGVELFITGEGFTPARVRTDADGLASVPVPSPLREDPSKGGGALLVTLDDGGRFGVATSNWTQGAQTYQLDLPLEYYDRQWVGQLYADRPIYRPGETVNFKGVVREDDDALYTIPPASPPLEVVIVNPRGHEVKREDISLNEYGTFAGTFVLPRDAPVGDYSISIQPAGSPDYTRDFVAVAGNSFLVAEFRKPEFQVELTTSNDTYLDGETIDVTTTASYYFGGPVPGAEVTWSAMASPTALHTGGFEQYSFADYDYWRQPVSENPIRATGSSSTGSDGVARFTVPAALQARESSMAFTLSATVTDANAQAVASSTVVTVHPAAVAVGVHPEEYIGASGEPLSVGLVTVDTTGKPVSGKDVTVRVYERKWVTTKEQTPDGARQYRSEPEDTLVQTVEESTAGDGTATVSYTPSKSGTLRIVAEVVDDAGRTWRSAAYVWVYGGGRASWEVRNDDTLTLVADRDSYEVGDTAEILVPAPFTGAIGLVTVERGGILSREVRDFPSDSGRISIPITQSSLPNVFVSVVLYRPPTADDPLPRYKVGYVELPVSTATRELEVTVRPDREQASPGATVHYDIQVTDTEGRPVQAEVSVSVVDKALLALEAERGPDGLRAFWFERGLGVTTASSLAVSADRSNDVVSAPPSGGKGGGGLEDDRLREDFRNSAFWAAQVETGPDGTAGVDVTMPDNLTTWRMAVRAVSGDTMVGEGSAELLSTQALLIRPALPRFLRVGDSPVIRTLIRNATEEAVEITAAIEVEGLELEDDGDQDVEIAPGDSATVSWPARATAEGTARVTFTARGGGLEDAVSLELPVLLDVTPETTATGGIVTGAAGLESLYLPPFAVLDDGKLEVGVQPVLAGSMAEELPELASYEGEDTVRIASRLMATLGVARAASTEAPGAQSTHQETIESAIAALVSSQRPDGGWSWCGIQMQACASDPRVTAWVLLALGEALRDGRSFDTSGLPSAGTHLAGYLSRPADVAEPANPNLRALMLAAMAAADTGVGPVTLAPARALFEQYRSQLNNWGRAYLAMALADSGAEPDDPQVGQLLNDIAAASIPSANGNHWEDEPVPGSFHTNTATTALVTLALSRLEPEQPLLPQAVRWLVVARGARAWETTVERAQAVLALTSFAEVTGELAGDFNYRVELDGRELIAGAVRPGVPLEETQATVPLREFEPGRSSLLAILRDFERPGRLYYTLNLRYMTPAREVEALNRGFAVTREYSLLDGPDTPVTSAKLGDTVRVKLTVLVPADRNYAEIRDLLPAGLEAIDTRLDIVDPAVVAQLEAERRRAAQENAGGYSAPWFGWYWSPWQTVETRDDRTVLLADTLPEGVYEYTYYARATTPGDFFAAPVEAAETYFPEVFGRSDSGRFTVTE